MIWNQRSHPSHTKPDSSTPFPRITKVEGSFNIHGSHIFSNKGRESQRKSTESYTETFLTSHAKDHLNESVSKFQETQTVLPELLRNSDG
jgi:hypothetical protein